MPWVFAAGVIIAIANDWCGNEFVRKEGERWVFVKLLTCICRKNLLCFSVLVWDVTFGKGVIFCLFVPRVDRWNLGFYVNLAGKRFLRKGGLYDVEHYWFYSGFYVRWLIWFDILPMKGGKSLCALCLSLAALLRGGFLFCTNFRVGRKEGKFMLLDVLKIIVGSRLWCGIFCCEEVESENKYWNISPRIGITSVVVPIRGDLTK